MSPLFFFVGGSRKNHHPEERGVHKIMVFCSFRCLKVMLKKGDMRISQTLFLSKMSKEGFEIPNLCNIQTLYVQNCEHDIMWNLFFVLQTIIRIPIKQPKQWKVSIIKLKL